MTVGAFSDGDWFEVRRLLEQLNSRLDELLRTAVLTNAQGVGIRFGATTLTWAAAQVASNTRTITHGLGKTPVFVGVFGSDAATAQLFYCYPFTFTSTQFSVKGVASAAPGVQTVSAVWVVIG